MFLPPPTALPPLLVSVISATDLCPFQKRLSTHPPWGSRSLRPIGIWVNTPNCGAPVFFLFFCPPLSGRGPPAAGFPLFFWFKRTRLWLFGWIQGFQSFFQGENPPIHLNGFKGHPSWMTMGRFSSTTFGPLSPQLSNSLSGRPPSLSTPPMQSGPHHRKRSSLYFSRFIDTSQFFKRVPGLKLSLFKKRPTGPPWPRWCLCRYPCPPPPPPGRPHPRPNPPHPDQPGSRARSLRLGKLTPQDPLNARPPRPTPFCTSTKTIFLHHPPSPGTVGLVFFFC